MLRDISYTIVARFAALFLSMLSLMLSAKYYGPEGRGFIAGTTTMASVMATLGGLSIGRVLVFEINRAKKHPLEFFRAYISSILALCFLLSLLIYIVALVLYAIRNDLYGKIDATYYVLVFTAVPALIWSGNSIYTFSSINRLHAQNTIGLIVQSVYIAIVALAIFGFGAGLIWFLVLMTASNIATAACEIYYLIRLLKPEWKVDWSEIGILVRNGMKLHADTMGGILITSANILILNYYLAPREVGIYQMAMQLVSMIIIVPTVVALAFNHEIATLGHDAALIKHSRYYYYVMIMMVVLCGASYVIIPRIIVIVASNRFNDSVMLFRLLLLSVVGNTFCTLLGPQLASRGYFKYLSFSTILLGAGGLLVSSYLIKRFHMAGAAYSTIIVYTVGMVLNLFVFGYLRKKARVTIGQVSENPA